MKLYWRFKKDGKYSWKRVTGHEAHQMSMNGIDPESIVKHGEEK